MSWFSQDFRRRFKHTGESFLLCVLLFASAIALTYVEDWMRTSQRPEWLIMGVDAISIALFVTDGIAFICLCLHFVKHSIRSLWKRR